MIILVMSLVRKWNLHKGRIEIWDDCYDNWECNLNSVWFLFLLNHNKYNFFFLDLQMLLKVVFGCVQGRRRMSRLYTLAHIRELPFLCVWKAKKGKWVISPEAFSLQTWFVVARQLTPNSGAVASISWRCSSQPGRSTSSMPCHWERHPWFWSPFVLDGGSPRRR